MTLEDKLVYLRVSLEGDRHDPFLEPSTVINRLQEVLEILEDMNESSCGGKCSCTSKEIT